MKSPPHSKKICLVCSSGGHLLEMLRISKSWKDTDIFWVTFKTEDALTLLEGEKVYYAYHPTNRNLKNLFKNFFFSRVVLKKEKPTHLISTGAGIAFPFFLWGKFLKIPGAYIESITRIHELSLTGKLVYPLAKRFYVQWEKLAEVYKKAIYKGSIL